MAAHHLAQCNVARLLAPLDSPLLAGFVSQVDSINALAERSPGFIWHFQDENGDAEVCRLFGDDMLLANMSVWTSVESLAAFTYKSAHRRVMRRRREWFSTMVEAHLVLWWTSPGLLPTLHDAKARFDLLRAHGPSPEAFTFREAFPPPGDGPVTRDRSAERPA